MCIIPNWEKLFQNVHDQLKIYNKTLVNIVHNYVPDKYITCTDKDPPWLNDHTNDQMIKCSIKQKNEIF